MAFQSNYTFGDGIAITPNDTTQLDKVYGLYIGTAGTLTVITAGGTTLAFGAVTAGSIIPLRVSVVKTTGTTATNIVGLLP